ncbi:DMT family transporter [Odoribacter sp. OttesenSCG-928-L07]|nr:DMT family transporter [Odoribacter sp. OttesenSCG-928-L07]MDL2239601.1 DMT family transporter [Bacteroidales bacterium OttesenSCG-928-L14]MDL2240763.1 DMT family transporter [Bacteroidales bacterium OttesenSCG-928-K22]
MSTNIKTNNNKLRAISISGSIAVIIAAIMWGVDGVLLTPRLLDNTGHALNTSFVVFVLHLIPFVLMNFVFYKYYTILKQFTLKDFLCMFLVALLGGAIGTMCIVKALFLVNFQNLTIVALLQKLQPVFAIILSVIILKEKLSKQYFLWAALALAAGYVMTFGFNPPSSESSNIIQAALYALGAAFCFGSSTVFSKILLNKYSSPTITFFRYGFTTVIALIICLLSGAIMQFHIVPTKTWIIFLLIAFTTGSGAIFLYYYGLQKIKASVSSILELFFPITAALLDYFINNNTMTVVQWIAAAVMIFSIIRLSRKG